MTNIILSIMLTWLPRVLSAMSELPKPVNVTLSSSHFIHLLTWEPGPGSPADVYYNVFVHSGSSSHAELVAGCKHVEHPLVCNLTEAFPDPEQDYYSQVTAVHEAQASEAAYVSSGFQPIKDSHLDLPLLAVAPCARDLCVVLQPPVERLRNIYDFFNYNLQIQSSSGQLLFSRDTRSLKTEPLTDLAPGREYCVSVRFSDSVASRVSGYGRPRCATTTAVYTADIQISVVLCSLLAMPLLCVGLLFWTGFLCQKWQLPLTLTSIKHSREVTASPCDGHLSFAVYVESAVPPAGNKGNQKDSEDDSDGESEEEEDTSGSRGRGYETQAAANPLSSFSSLSVEFHPPACGDSQLLLPPPSGCPRMHLDPCSPPAEPRPSPLLGVPESAAPGQGLRYHRCVDVMETDAVRGAAGAKSGEESEGSAGGQDVNFLSVTLGAWCALEEDPAEPNSPYHSNNTAGDTEDVAMETVTTDLVEEEEEEGEGEGEGGEELCGNGYMSPHVT